jgi:DNA-binding Lrp family transcriptional regulator
LATQDLLFPHILFELRLGCPLQEEERMRPNMETMPRNKVIEELTSLGIYDISSMESFSDNVLMAMLSGFQKAIKKTSTTNIQQQGSISRRPSLAHSSPKLSRSDKKILKVLANSKERLSALALSKELGIPITTVQRRRKKLESEFLETRYSLKYETFGLRKAVLFISTNGGTATDIGNRILKERYAISAERIIGENNTSISSKVLFRENIDLLNIIEKIKSLDGVDNVTWIEIVEVLQTRPDAPLNVLEG